MFADYTQRADLQTFADYLEAAGIEAPTAGDLHADPAAWAGVTWGLVAGFVQWMLGQGLALPSVNRKLSTVKTYVGLAARAGALSGDALALIKNVRGYAAKEFKRVDAKRTVTRQGAKKADTTAITADQAQRLKQQPDTPQGRRDAVIMALLIDHGLRVGETAALQVGDVDLGAGELRFYRPKVGKVQTHRLTRDALAALQAWLAADALALGPLLRGLVRAGHWARSA